MPKYNIEGIEVHFPYSPYQCQFMYMQTVLRTLKHAYLGSDVFSEPPNGSMEVNGYLESPTGTGKGMCLLCSCYAFLIYLRKVKPNWESFPRIIFTSRTHTQLSHAMKELMKSPYSNSSEISLIGSRNQLCVHPEVNILPKYSISSECAKKRNSSSCKYFLGVENVESSKVSYADIEDLLNVATKKEFCPYYYTQGKKNDATILFMPYNYLVQPLIRKRSLIDVENDIVIVDEGHNLPSVCDDGFTFHFNSFMMAHIWNDYNTIISISKQQQLFENSNSSVNDFLSFQEKVLEFEMQIENISLHKQSSLPKGYFSSKVFFDIFDDILGINETTFRDIIGLLKRAVTVLVKDKKNPLNLNNFIDLIENIFEIGARRIELESSFKLQIEDIPSGFDPRQYENFLKQRDKHVSQLPNSLNVNLGPKSATLFCFNPSLAMKSLRNNAKPKSILLTSGTLSPMKGLSTELGLNFLYALENGHVISKDQLSVMVCKIGKTGIPLKSAFDNRSNDSYLIEVGEAILGTVDRIPDGVLVFFSSYSVMNLCIDKWKSHGIYNALSEKKRIFQEPSSSRDVSAIIDEYEKTISTGKGAIMLGVCRGKVSEGIDFANENGRGIFIVGIPYPPQHDPKIILKQNTVTDIAEHCQSPYDGKQWYIQQGARAVNQSIGRLIRHRHDYGVVILMDERFSHTDQKELLSEWLHKFVTIPSTFEEIPKMLVNFFKKERKSVIPKIPVIEKRYTIQDYAPPPVQLPTISNKKMTKVERRANFVNDIKKVLTVVQYQRFKVLVKGLNSSQNIQSEIQELCELFKEHQPLLENLQSCYLRKYSHLFDQINRKRPSTPPPNPPKRKKIESTSTLREPLADQSTQPSGFKCMICQDIANGPKVAKCGHVACSECWERWLQQKCECPVCRKRTVPHLLTLIHG